MDRRQFLQSTTMTGLALASAGAAGAAEGKRLRAGVIGCGWYGMVDCRHMMLLAPVEVVAVCDVDKKNANDAADEIAAKQKERPQIYGDFREMLKAGKLDIVIVGTPDHWHPLCAIAAMKAGADVYVEKPISHTYREGQAMVAAARTLNRVVQVGTQRRSTEHFRSARELVKEGKLGTIGLARAFCYYHMRPSNNPPDCPPPETLDFDFWCGPAPKRPFNPIMHPKGWRHFSEYSNGILGDMGVHMLDVTRWVLGITYPKHITSAGGIFLAKQGKANTTDTQTVTYDYGDLTVLWEHRMWGRNEDPKVGWGVNFYGDKGTLQLNIESWDFVPAPGNNEKPIHVEAKREPNADVAKFEGTHIFPAGRAHWQNFLAAVESRQRPVADIAEGHISTALCQLGNISQRLGRSLTWDAKAEQVVSDEEANKLLQRQYRSPWVYPES